MSKFLRCGQIGRRACLLGGFLLSVCLSGQAANDFSVAEQALFMEDHLAAIKPPVTLHYDFKKRGSLESSFDDSVDVTLTAQDDGTCCRATSRFLDGARKAPQPDIEGLRGNPVILYFLERDIQEMQRLTKGQPNYFRTRIRMSVYQSAAIRSIELPYLGDLVNVREITITPYQDDPLRNRFERFANKRYIFRLSSDVPGGVYSIQTSMADTSPDAAPLLTEQMTLDGAGPP